MFFTELGAGVGKAKAKKAPAKKAPAKKPSARTTKPVSTNPASRIIHVIGKADAYWGKIGATKSQVEEATRQAFVNQGWDIKSAQFEWQPAQNTWWFRIVVNVSSQYSNEEIKASAQSTLQAITGGFNTTVLSNILVDLEIPSTKTPETAPTYSQSAPESNKSASSGSNTSSESGFGFLSALGGGLGLSTPVVIVGVGVVLLIALKK